MLDNVRLENSNEIRGKTPGENKKEPRGQVFIHGKWCKGCHICVKFCPVAVLEMDASGDHPIVAHPENCTACHFCDTHCPDLAIVVKRIQD